MTFESKFAIDEAVYYHEPNRNIRHSGVIVSVTFTEASTSYTVKTMMGTTHSIPESVIEKKE